MIRRNRECPVFRDIGDSGHCGKTQEDQPFGAKGGDRAGRTFDFLFVVLHATPRHAALGGKFGASVRERVPVAPPRDIGTPSRKPFAINSLMKMSGTCPGPPDAFLKVPFYGTCRDISDAAAGCSIRGR